MNLRDTRLDLAKRLRDAGVEEPDAVAEFALADLLSTGRAEIVARGSDVFPDALRHRLGALAARLAGGEPLAYALGWTEFLGRRFRCDRRALIPRPETEGLVAAALAEPAARAPGARLADVGTGSGVIAVSLALALPQAWVLAIDRSAEALALARGNAIALGALERIAFEQADLLDDRTADSLDLVAANLPYVESGQLAALPRHVRDFEPVAALDGGPDGLDFIRRLAPQATLALRPGGVLLLEIGEAQGPAVRALLAAAGFTGIAVRRDDAGHDRIVRANCPGS